VRAARALVCEHGAVGWGRHPDSAFSGGLGRKLRDDRGDDHEDDQDARYMSARLPMRCEPERDGVRPQTTPEGGGLITAKTPRRTR